MKKKIDTSVINKVPKIYRFLALLIPTAAIYVIGVYLGQYLLAGAPVALLSVWIAERRDLSLKKRWWVLFSMVIILLITGLYFFFVGSIFDSLFLIFGPVVLLMFWAASNEPWETRWMSRRTSGVFGLIMAVGVIYNYYLGMTFRNLIPFFVILFVWGTMYLDHYFHSGGILHFVIFSFGGIGFILGGIYLLTLGAVISSTIYLIGGSAILILNLVTYYQSHIKKKGKTHKLIASKRPKETCELIEDIVDEYPYVITDSKKEEGKIELSSEPSISSWGENIDIRIKESSLNRTLVEIKARPKTQLSRFAKLDENLCFLSNKIKEMLLPPPPPPDEI